MAGLRHNRFAFDQPENTRRRKIVSILSIVLMLAVFGVVA